MERLSYGLASCLVIASRMTETATEPCVYSQISTDLTRTNRSQMATTEDCQWGCCSGTGSPCCSVPINLLIGVILGGVFVAAILAAVIYYYCVYRRGEICLNMRIRFRNRQPALDTRIHQVTTGHRPANIDNDGLPAYPGVSDPPPSYEEVMKAHTNNAYSFDVTDEGARHGI